MKRNVGRGRFIAPDLRRCSQSRGGVRRKYAAPQSVKSEGLTQLAPPVLVSDHFVASNERLSERIEDPPSLSQPAAVAVALDRQPTVVVKINPSAHPLEERAIKTKRVQLDLLPGRVPKRPSPGVIRPELEHVQYLALSSPSTVRRSA